MEDTLEAIKSILDEDLMRIQEYAIPIDQARVARPFQKDELGISDPSGVA